jgi:hypothetical protein
VTGTGGTTGGWGLHHGKNGMKMDEMTMGGR